MLGNQDRSLARVVLFLLCSPILSPLEVVSRAVYDDFTQLRERSILIMGTRAEDNFAQLEKISYPHLEYRTGFRTPTIFQQNGLVPHPEVSVHKTRSMERYQVVPGDFHTVQVIHIPGVC